MGNFLVILHVLVAVALILTVLLQAGKGAGIGAAFGGGSSGTVFGSRGPAGFMSKLTAAAAILFMVTSLGLSFYKGDRIGGGSAMDQYKTPATQQDVTTPTADDQKSEAVKTESTETVKPETVPAPAEPELPKEEAKPIAPENETN